MLIKNFTLTFVALAASVNALAIPIHYRRADNVAATGDNGAHVADSAPKIDLPPSPAAKVVSPQGAAAPASPATVIPIMDSPSQKSSVPPPAAANSAQTTTPAVVDMPAIDNTQTATSATDAPTIDTAQTTKQSTGAPETNDAQPSKLAADTPNKGAADTGDSPASQSVADSPVVNNNNTPAPLATTPDAPPSNHIQPQSQSIAPTESSVQSLPSDTVASEPSENQITPLADAAPQAISEPAANSSTEPQGTQAHTPETQVASEPQAAAAALTPEPNAANELQAASEPNIKSSTDSPESQSTSTEVANPEAQLTPAVETKPESPATPAKEPNPEPQNAPVVEAKPKPQSAPVAEDKPKPQPAPVAEDKPKPQPAPVVETKPAPQTAPAAQTSPAPETPIASANAIECLTLLMKTQQPLTGTCQKLIRDDSTLIQSAELGLVGLDFMYSGKDFPVISSDSLRLKLKEIPGYSLSVVEARYDVMINYKDHDTASFSAPWSTSTMQGSTLTTAIDKVDVKVISSTAFTDLIAAMLTKPKTPITLKGTVDINISFPSADGGAPTTVIIAGLQFSSPFHMPGLNGLAQKNFVRSEDYRVYGDTFYFESIFNFVNPSNLKMNLGGVKFDVLDSAGKQLATSAIDVFEIDAPENDVTVRLIAKVDESAAFMNRIHNTGDTVTFQGTTGSSTNVYLGAALSQLSFTVTYPAVKEVPLQDLSPVADVPPKTPLPAANIPPKTPLPAVNSPAQPPLLWRL